MIIYTVSTSRVKRVLIASVIIGLLCVVSAYGSVSANPSRTDGSGRQTGGKGGDEKSSGGSGGNGRMQSFSCYSRQSLSGSRCRLLDSPSGPVPSARLAVLLGCPDSPRCLWEARQVGEAGRSAKRADPPLAEMIIIGAPQQTPSKENKTVDTEEINRLIKELNSDDIAVRDRATEGLKKIGSPAIPLLEEAAKSNDPEVAWRAKIIIKAITRAEQKKQQQPRLGRDSTVVPQDESPETLSKKIGPTLKQFSNRFNIIINNASPGTKSFALSQDSSGKITVTITEYDKDGKQASKTYTADSLDEFKKKYPEIAKEYGIGENPPPSIQIPDFDIDDIWKDFGNAWGQRWEDLRRQMEKLREMFKQFNQNIPGGIKPQQKPTTPPNSTNPDGFSEREPGTGHSEAPANLGIFIENLSDSIKQKSNIENGVLVTGVEENSVGEKMGLKENDIIISVNDSEAKTIWECRRQVKTALEQGSIKITIIRNGKKQTLSYPK